MFDSFTHLTLVIILLQAVYGFMVAHLLKVPSPPLPNPRQCPSPPPLGTMAIWFPGFLLWSCFCPACVPSPTPEEPHFSDTRIGVVQVGGMIMILHSNTQYDAVFFTRSWTISRTFSRTLQLCLSPFSCLPARRMASLWGGGLALKKPDCEVACLKSKATFRGQDSGFRQEIGGNFPYDLYK